MSGNFTNPLCEASSFAALLYCLWQSHRTFQRSAKLPALQHYYIAFGNYTEPSSAQRSAKLLASQFYYIALGNHTEAKIKDQFQSIPSYFHSLPRCYIDNWMLLQPIPPVQDFHECNSVWFVKMNH